MEHFGLGRYGDTLDYNGYLNGFLNIQKIVKINGKLYFSVPIGNQIIEFNAHRIFSLAFLISLIPDNFILDNFSYVDDMGNFHSNVNINKIDINSNLNCKYGCAIFELTRKY